MEDEMTQSMAKLRDSLDKLQSKLGPADGAIISQTANEAMLLYDDLRRCSSPKLWTLAFALLWRDINDIAYRAARSGAWNAFREVEDALMDMIEAGTEHCGCRWRPRGEL